MITFYRDTDSMSKPVTEVFKNAPKGSFFLHKKTKVIYQLRTLPIKKYGDEPRVKYLSNINNPHDTVFTTLKSEWTQCTKEGLKL